MKDPETIICDPTLPSSQSPSRPPSQKTKKTKKQKKRNGRRLKAPRSSPSESERYENLQIEIDRLEEERISAKLQEAEARSQLITINGKLLEKDGESREALIHVRRTVDNKQIEIERLQRLAENKEEENQICIRDHDKQRDFLINLFHVQQSRHQQEMVALRKMCKHEIDTEKLRLQENQLLREEALNEEIIHLRTTVVEMDSAINEINNLHLEQVEMNLKHNSNQASNNSNSKFKSLTKAALAIKDINARLQARNEKTAMEVLQKGRKKKVDTKGFISSWLDDTRAAFDIGMGDVDPRKLKKIDRAVEKNNAKITKEVDKTRKHLATIEAQQQERSKTATEKWMQAAKSLKSGPGRMTVAVAKLEHEIEFIKNKLELAEEREERTRELLNAAESTILNMVRDKEAEAILLTTIEPDDSHLHPPPPGLKRVSANEKIAELERQKNVLCNLLNEYDSNSEYNIYMGKSLDNMKLSMMTNSPEKDKDMPETEISFRDNLIDILRLGGNNYISDNDILCEVQQLYLNRKRYVSLEPMQMLPTLDSPQGQQLEELLTAKELQAKHERKRQHSVKLSTAEKAWSDHENEMNKANKARRKGRKHTTDFTGVNDVLDSAEMDHARRMQDRGRVRSLGVGGMQQAVEESEKKERQKAQMAQVKRGRKHTVNHSSAQDAVQISNINENLRKDNSPHISLGPREYEDDFESEIESDDEEDYYDEAEIELAKMEAEKKHGEQLEKERIYRENLKKEREMEEKERVRQEKIEKKKRVKLILNESRSYRDPCGNFIRFTLSSYFLGTTNEDGLNEYKIVAYDQELCCKASMFVNEDMLRLSLHHKKESFTYDASDHRLHKLLLDQFVLVPCHDSNHDGFINEDDVKRDDLTFALVSSTSVKPIITMKKHDENDNTESEEEDEDENDESSEFRQRSVYELQDGVMAAHGVNMGAYY